VLPVLRWRFAILAARFKALDALRWRAWMRLRRESESVGIEKSPLDGP
jgi:hypothetical protein